MPLLDGTPAMAMRQPAISVVIPTYNWSAALRCAIRSVLLQTMQDFEILVVGDGCTDDSEAIVAAFNDPRLRWYNLDRNYGPQWAANNFAIEHAAADWIAYLGHDDIWYPTHLAAILRTAELDTAEIVTSTVIFYGPAGAGARGIAGIFPSGASAPGDFVPPSAVAHAKALYGAVVRRRDPETVVSPMDAAFLNELAAAKRKFASTHELTCFKFNAARRRDAYRVKAINEQLRMLERIESGTDFRQAELLEVLQSVVSGRFVAVRAPAEGDTEEGAIVRRNRQFKGLDSRFGSDALRRIEQVTRFDMSEQVMPFEWHAMESDADHGSFRWTGPSPRATIDLPVVFDRDLAIRIHVIATTLQPEAIDRIRLFVHDQPLPTQIRQTDSTYLLEAQLRRADMPSTDRDFGITIDAGSVARPCDLGTHGDNRWLGLAINWIELSPVPADGRAPQHRYLPPFTMIRRLAEISDFRGAIRVGLAYDDFVKLLRLLLSAVQVDEAWYLKQYGDVAKAIEQGTAASAKRHFVESGYFEGRLPFPPDMSEKC